MGSGTTEIPVAGFRIDRMADSAVVHCALTWIRLRRRRSAASQASRN